MDFTSSEHLSYDDQTFKNGEFAQQTIQAKEFNGCTFIRCSFNETVLRKCVFRNCHFKDCDLSIAQVKDTAFSGVKFEDSKLVGINWSAARWTKLGLLDASLDFVNCVLNYSTFIGVSLKKASLTRRSEERRVGKECRIG